MNTKKEAVEQWPDEKARKYLDMQYPNEKIEWIVLEKTGLYGFSDTDGSHFACADDDEVRAVGITEFLIRNGGSYISNA